MPGTDVTTPIATGAVDRLSLEAVRVREGAGPDQWGNPTCPTCICAADD